MSPSEEPDPNGIGVYYAQLAEMQARMTTLPLIATANHNPLAAAIIKKRKAPYYDEMERQIQALREIKKEHGTDHWEYKMVAEAYTKMHDAWIKEDNYDYWGNIATISSEDDYYL